MNLQLDDLALFVRVVELGTLSAAARERNGPVSQVTRALARLEAQCGARLLHRSTHGLTLTDEGDTVLAHARQMLQTSLQLESELSGRLAGPRGWVRVGSSAVIAQAVLAPSLPSLLAAHPGLRLDIVADDRMVDMAREGLDLTIRTGTPAGEDLVAREIGQLSRSLYAAPAYAQAHGLPIKPEQLADHQLVGHALMPVLNTWTAGEGRAQRRWTISPSVRAGDTGTVLALVRAGVGIGRIVDLVARPLVRAGQLLPVLPEWFGEKPLPMYAVMLRERHRLPKVRACIEHWVAWMAAV